jgi:hypothetical protein
MAEQFDYLGLFSENPPASGQAGTAVLPEAGLKDYWNLSETKYRNKLFEYEKKRQEGEDMIAATDLNTEGVWNVDLPKINETITSFREFARTNPEAVLDPLNPKHGEYQKLYDNAKMTINRSKQHKLTYDYWLPLVKDPLYKNQAAEMLQSLNGWRDNLDRDEFGGFIPKPDFNPFEVFEKIKGTVGKEEEIGKVKYIGGGLMGVPKTSQLNPEDIDNAIDIAYAQNLYGVRDEFDEKFAFLSPELKEQYGDSLGFAKATFRSLNTKEKSNDIRSVNYAPQGGDSKDGNPEWIAKNALKLSDPNSDIYTQNVVDENGKVIGRKSLSFKDTPIRVRKKDDLGDIVTTNTTIDAIFNVNGKLYAVPKTARTSEKASLMDEWIEITDPKNQLIVPFVNRTTEVSPATSGLIQKTFDIYDNLNASGEKSGTSDPLGLFK